MACWLWIDEDAYFNLFSVIPREKLGNTRDLCSLFPTTQIALLYAISSMRSLVVAGEMEFEVPLGSEIITPRLWSITKTFTLRCFLFTFNYWFPKLNNNSFHLLSAHYYVIGTVSNNAVIFTTEKAKDSRHYVPCLRIVLSRIISGEAETET